jgi:hypothetical protein
MDHQYGRSPLMLLYKGGEPNIIIFLRGALDKRGGKYFMLHGYSGPV